MARTFGQRIADVLMEDGILLPTQFEEIRAIQKQQGGRLVKLLTDSGYVTDGDMMISMGRCLDVPPINLSKVRIPDKVGALVPKEMARQYKLMPICKLGSKLFVAMADPMNVLAIDDIRQLTRLEIIPMIATEKAIQEALSGVNTGGLAMDEVMKSAAEEAGEMLSAPETQHHLDLDENASPEDGPVVRIVNMILVQALKEKASDIHIEPFEKGIKLRYRVDGNLIEASSPPKALQLPMVSRVKILAGLDIAERRLPQDGRFRIQVSGKEIDLRISILPTVHGEKIVIRILDKSSLSGSIDQLGLDEATFKVFKNAIDAPHGMILLTGPTGSGKTTTLYSALQELNSPEYNIVTVEDPVEYQLMGVNQVAVRAEVGLTFAAALRSILRQDPDIVMIGEIRDQETADIAVKAALTGHQVLSTLHTNDAAGAISRLDDMGIEPFLIASSLLLTCAQRLVRRICSNCKEEFIPEDDIFLKLGFDELVGETFYRGAGCERCKQRGYAGRAALLEVLPVTESVRKLIIKRATASVIKNQAIQEGMKTLRMVGLDKAREGVTTLEEVFRVTAEDH
ncbi:MAG TPA: ATPase, T2SS/T4P/T4SS family [Chthoniobacteraceae bacterium]|nr:ATPase, T2SS/T4P/T4SS family [Chthoniobacteraceae bacterium]